MRRKKINPDMLKQKKSELESYVAEFDSTVGMITDAVDSLSMLNSAIGEKVAEIENYEAELANTKAGLQAARQRNERVIRNFNALIGDE